LANFQTLFDKFQHQINFLYTENQDQNWHKSFWLSRFYQSPFCFSNDKNMPCGPVLFRWVDMKPTSYMVKEFFDFLEQPDIDTNICNKDIYIYTSLAWKGLRYIPVPKRVIYGVYLIYLNNTW